MKKNINLDNTFKKIENVRSKNNKNWMEILKIAYLANPKKTSSVLKRILEKDRKLIKLADALSKIK